ncbi:MAG TPA: hypothetical protein VF618_12995 [Thermoanaerobaculia bacterium]
MSESDADDAEVFGDEFANALENLIASYERDVDLPRPDETAAVTFTAPKTAALCYDRVWAGIRYDIPAGVGFRGASSKEKYVMATGDLLDMFADLRANGDADTRELAAKVSSIAAASFFDTVSPGDAEPSKVLEHITRGIADGLIAEYGIAVVPLYDSRESRNADYQAGDRSVVVATLSNVALVEEEALTWEQIVELRRDATMLRHFRRLMHWLDAELVGKSSSFIQDEIANRLEEYEAVIKKHGFTTRLGMLESVLDSNTLLGGSAAVASLSYAADFNWALIGGGAVLVGRAAVSIAKATINARELRRTTHPEIAFVAEVKNRINRGAG